jgi:peptidoglycan hydrolase-like protein with peptidoglycan-binding domain
VLARGSTGVDVRTWQRQMARRGWRIKVDGIFGPQTASVARRFQREKGLRVDALVGPRTWAAAWRRPVT